MNSHIMDPVMNCFMEPITDPAIDIQIDTGINHVKDPVMGHIRD